MVVGGRDFVAVFLPTERYQRRTAVCACMNQEAYVLSTKHINMWCTTVASQKSCHSLVKLIWASEKVHVHFNAY